MDAAADAFRVVSLDEFRSALAAAPLSSRLALALLRFEPFNHWIAHGAALHSGDLVVEGSFKPPAFATLIVGDLVVGGIVDSRNDADEEGGLLIVIGSVTCRDFVGEFGKCVFIDGDLEARGTVLTGFSDFSLVVTGGLSARLFIGGDIWAEVGDGAAMDYGIGYCLPLGWVDAEREAMRPLHDEAATVDMVWPEPVDGAYRLEAEQFLTRLDAGLPLFRD